MNRPLITISTPHRLDFTPEYVSSLAAILTADLGVRFEFLTRPGTFLHEQRNALARAATGDYLLFVDTDMVWQPQDVEALLALDVDIMGGLYCNTNPAHSFYVFYEDEAGVIRPMTQVPAEPFQCAAIGTGFLLIRRRVLETMLAPTFIREHGFPFDPTVNDAWEGADPNSCTGWAPEDVSFCLRARRAGFSIWCNPTVKLGHMGYAVAWPDMSLALEVL